MKIYQVCCTINDGDYGYDCVIKSFLKQEDAEKFRADREEEHAKAQEKSKMCWDCPWNHCDEIDNNIIDTTKEYCDDLCYDKNDYFLPCKNDKSYEYFGYSERYHINEEDVIE